jgi:NADH-quinone oxidoreductase subunit A
VQTAVLPVLVFVGATVGLAVGLLVLGNWLNPGRPGRVKRMPYESGMDPAHDTRRRFDVRFHLLAIAFLVFDVELLFLYPWAVSLHRDGSGAAAEFEARAVEGREKQFFSSPSSSGASAPPAAPAGPTPEASGLRPAFLGGMVFVSLLALGFIYDWRKGILQWR